MADSWQFAEQALTSRELENELHLDGRIERQNGHSDGASGVCTGVAEDLTEKLGCAIDHAGLAGESGVGGDEADDLHDARDPVERADDGCRRSEAVER